VPSDHAAVFAHACKMGLEGIVSKRKDSMYRSGRLARLAQNEERRCSGGEARRARGLGQMTHTHSLPHERWGEK
jgi:hypothetical protein